MLYSPVCIFYFHFYFNDYASLFIFFLSVYAKDVKKYISQTKFCDKALLAFTVCKLYQD